MTRSEEVTAVHAAVTARGLTKNYDGVSALDGVDLTLREGAIHGLLGRNGAGKTTLMRVLAAQALPNQGRLEVFDRPPFENADVLSRICLVREEQRYPDGYKVQHVLQAARMCHRRWDERYARTLIDAFELPRERAVKQLSRGMLSAVGIVVGLASRAPLTLFDEPYLGLDPVARSLFYDLLLADVAERPRTVILSTHLIDEAADLLEHVVLLDRGRVLLEADAEALRQFAVTLTGPAADVETAIAHLTVLDREQVGRRARATVSGTLGPSHPTGPELDRPRALGLEIEPVSLQQLMVHLTAVAPAVDQTAVALAVDGTVPR